MNRPESSRGQWTIAAMFALGGVVLAGLFLAPRPAAPRAPAGVQWGTPARPMRVALYDASGLTSPAAVAAEVREAAGDVDFVLLFHVAGDEAAAFARAFAMQRSFHPQLCQRVASLDGGADPGAICVLSKHPLYEGAPLRIDRKRAYGVEAIAVVDGRKFRVVGVLLPDAEGGTPVTWPGGVTDLMRDPSLLGTAGGRVVASPHWGIVRIPLAGRQTRLMALAVVTPGDGDGAGSVTGTQPSAE